MGGCRAWGSWTATTLTGLETRPPIGHFVVNFVDVRLQFDKVYDKGIKLRHAEIKTLEKEEQGKLITKDDLEKGKKQLDDMAKQYTDKVDHMVKHKSDEIMQG